MLAVSVVTSVSATQDPAGVDCGEKTSPKLPLGGCDGASDPKDYLPKSPPVMDPTKVHPKSLPAPTPTGSC